MIEKIYSITPVPKPRMTQRDKWAKRPAVMRYRDFADGVRLLNIRVPESGASIVFGLPMPKSWSKKKRLAMDGQPHQQKPDIDNLLKALLDSIYAEDCGVYHIGGMGKYWSKDGYIKIIIK